MNVDVTSNDDIASNEKWPLWDYVTKVDKIGENGGTCTWQCNFCKGEYQRIYSRVKAHLLKLPRGGIAACRDISYSERLRLGNIDGDAEAKGRRGHQKKVSIPHSMSSGQPNNFIDTLIDEQYPNHKRARGDKQIKIDELINQQGRRELDKEIARSFYSGGIPFHFAKNPHFRRSYALACSLKLPGYFPPSYNALRTKLLDDEVGHINLELQSIRECWGKKGVSIVCDGWTDPQRRPLINFVAINNHGAVFLHAINCEDARKDQYFICAEIEKVVEEVGIKNVVQVITDNAPVCKAAGMLLKKNHPQIYWTPCIVHTLNLALKDIFNASGRLNSRNSDDCTWISEVVSSMNMIQNFINNHSKRLSMFRKFSKLTLLRVAETRFASHIVMMKRFQEVKDALRAMVIASEWSTYKHDNPNKAVIIRQKLLDDSLWESIDYILKFTKPMYDMLRECDLDKRPTLHRIYEMWDTLLTNVKIVIFSHEGKNDGDDSDFWNIIYTVLTERRDKSLTPLHAMAYSLNPRITTNEWQLKHPNLPQLENDRILNNLRMQYLDDFFQDDDRRVQALTEYSRFMGCLHDFSIQSSMTNRLKMEPIEWWLTYGVSAPLLQNLALKLLAQVSSSSCCERNWSTYSFIHSTRRSSMNPKRAEKLVYIHSNLRMLSRSRIEYSEGDTKMWDLGGDKVNTFDDVSLLEMATLSLDEPELERVLFENPDLEDDQNA